MGKFRIRFAPWTPFADALVSDDNKTYLSGIAADIYEGMKTLMNFEYEAKIQPDKTFGVRDVNGKWSGMIGSMLQNETDVSGPYFINEDRSNAVEFAIPLAFCQLVLVSGLVPTNRDPFLIFRIFSWPVWLAMFLSIIIAAGAACVIYQTLSSFEKRSKIETFSKYIWTFQFCLLGKDFGSNERWFMRHVWLSPSFRFLQCVWFTTACLVLMYTYQGAIISVFAADKSKPKIETMDDLLQDTSIKFSTFRNSYPQKIISNLVNTQYESLWFRIKKNLVTPTSKGSIPAWMDLVEKGKSVFFAEAMTMKDLIGDRFLKTGKCGLRVVTVDLGSAYAAIAFRKQFYNSSILRKFNRGLRRFNEGNLARRRFIHSTLFYDICTGVSASIVKPLNLIDLLGAFIVLATGIGLSLILFCIELSVTHGLKKYK